MNILTSFPFTFKLTVPGLSNPFTSLSTTPSPTTSRNAPTRSGEPPFERPTRSLVRPTRPLPISVTAATPMAIPASSRGVRRPRPTFSPSPSPTPSASLSLAPNFSHLTPGPRFSHSPSPAPLSRKRGWEPSCSPSLSETTLTSTNGYLDTPARYRDGMEVMEALDVGHLRGMRELDEDDLPPAKRRRGLAGSIVSTAWSAALIGSAVGLTVYKLWRDRGKGSRRESTEPYHNHAFKSHNMMDETSPEPSSPPPPYNQEWTTINYPQHLTPRRDKGKQRATPRSARKTVGRRGEKPTTLRRPATLGRPTGSTRPAIPSEFGFGASGSEHQKKARLYDTSIPHADDDTEVPEADNKMDWIGGRLAQLIEEGKKALGKEVVVMSDAKEDEEDDGSGAWVSDEDERVGLKRKGSTRSSRSMTVTGGGYIVSPPGLPSSSSSTHLPTTPRRTHSRGMSHDGIGSPSVAISTVAGVDQSNWESPEVREMMERARAKLSARLAR